MTILDCSSNAKKLFLTLVLLFILPFQSTCPTVFAASVEDILVGYGGVYTAGANDSNYPHYKRNKLMINKKISATLEQLKEEGKLPFNLLFDTDVESVKQNIDAPCTLAVVITRDDIATEHFETGVAKLNKTIVNVGMVIILYKTAEDLDSGKKRNIIIFSIPLVAYSLNLEGNKQLSDSEIDDIFINNCSSLLKDHLSKRLQKLSLEQIHGTVKDVKDEKAIIDIGAIDGLDKGQTIYFLDDTGKVPGTIYDLKKREAIVDIKKLGKQIVRGMKVYGVNAKHLSTETYQVVNFTISSKKAAAMFEGDNAIGSQVSQWYSDFLAERAGKSVLPTKVGGDWVTDATGESFTKLVKDGQEHIFEVPPPKYPIVLDLSGVSSKMAQKNNVNEIWLYKAWLKVNMSATTFSKEGSENSSKSVVPGIQSFEEKAEIYDLIHKLTAKMAQEEGI